MRVRGAAVVPVVGACLALACASAGGPRGAGDAGPGERPEPDAALAAASEERAPAEDALEAAADPLLDPALEAPWLDEEAGADPAERDPLEAWNRQVFGFNEGFLGWVVDPVGGGLLHVVPEAGRRAVDRFFTNLGEPVTFVNDLLQLAPRHAGRSGARFVINTTLGLAGLFDTASRLGIEEHHSDFGQTLGVWCVRTGPYFVLPLIGPSTARDSIGTVFDFALRPDFWLLGLGPALLLYGGDQFVTYDVERERLAALRGTSVDFYAALRGAYLMDRDAFVAMRRRELGRGGESP
jgi:phospholipid-binding lipoprotein MlaA